MGSSSDTMRAALRRGSDCLHYEKLPCVPHIRTSRSRTLSDSVFLTPTASRSRRPSLSLSISLFSHRTYPLSFIRSRRFISALIRLSFLPKWINEVSLFLFSFSCRVHFLCLVSSFLLIFPPNVFSFVKSHLAAFSKLTEKCLLFIHNLILCRFFHYFGVREIVLVRCQEIKKKMRANYIHSLQWFRRNKDGGLDSLEKICGMRLMKVDQVLMKTRISIISVSRTPSLLQYLSWEKWLWHCGKPQSFIKYYKTRN